ncbi:MAG: hypothetical protein RJB61_743 [Actinomycetota bacterium]|jgi:predicted GNAT superfamily acetyltransferase
MAIEFRDLRTADDLAPLPEFEKFIWGGDSEMVSVNVLVATIEEGGMALAAYDGASLVGVVYGFATREPSVLHSHYLAVHPSHRGRGLGEQLKREQAAWCRAHGYTAMRWTFDPLQLPNAHLNLNKLGGVGVSYKVNLYGSLGGINGSLPSDRLVVRWELAEERIAACDVVTVDIPPVTADEIAVSAPSAHAARLALRNSLSELLADGWAVIGIDRPARQYVLGRTPPAAPA